MDRHASMKGRPVKSGDLQVFCVGLSPRVHASMKSHPVRAATLGLGFLVAVEESSMTVARSRTATATGCAIPATCWNLR